MKRVVFLLTAVTAAGLLAQTTVPAGQTQVRLVGLEVIKPDPKDELNSYVPGRNPGTVLHVMLTRPDKCFVSVDEEASKLLAFTDEKKTNLAKPTRERFGRGWLDWARISDDGRQCVLEVCSQSTPAPGASQLHLKANIVMVCGENEKTAEQKDLVLTKGSKLTAGPVPMEIKEVGEGGWGDAKLTLSLKHTISDDVIKELKFFGPDGKQIKHRSMGRMRSGFAGKYTYERSLALAEKVEKVTVRVTYYDKLEKLAVPVEIKTGVGF